MLRIAFGLFFVTPQGQPLGITINAPVRSHSAACMPKRVGCVDDSGMGPVVLPCPRLKGCRIDDSGMGPPARRRVHSPLLDIRDRR